MSIINTIEKVLIKFFSVFTGILLIFVLFFVILAVLDRHIFQMGFFWTEEMARSLYVWFTMLVPIIMITAGKQFVLEFFRDKFFSLRIRKILVLFVHLTILVIFFLILIGGLRYISIMGKQTMPTLRAPSYLVYMSLPIGMFFICVMEIVFIIKHLHSWYTDEENKVLPGRENKYTAIE